jgi:hypothetical protein
MQFTLRICPHCREFLKIPVGRSSVLCLYCGHLVPALPSECLQTSPSLRRIVSYILLGLLFVAALSLLISARLLGLGLDCLLYFLRHAIGWLVSKRPAHLSRHRTLHSRHMLTKATNHRMITKIAQSKET